MTHRCWACDPANAERIVFDEGGEIVMRFAARFAGPPGVVNGGMAAGALACPALHASHEAGAPHAAVTRISARLRKSVPVGRPLGVRAARGDGAWSVAVSEGATELLTGAVEVAALEAAPQPGDALPTEPPAHLAAALAEVAGVAVPDRAPFFEEAGEHPFPGCFSCGPENARGLRIFPRVAGHGLVCATWAPDASFDDGGGALAAAVVPAALDCSSGVCLPAEEQEALVRDDGFYLLGSMDVRYLRVAPVRLAGGYRVAGRMLAREGRKFFGLSALVDGDGTAYALAESTWIIAAARRGEAFGAAQGR